MAKTSAERDSSKSGVTNLAARLLKEYYGDQYPGMEDEDWLSDATELLATLCDEVMAALASPPPQATPLSEFVRSSPESREQQMATLADRTSERQSTVGAVSAEVEGLADKLQDAITFIEQWAQAYPETVFLPKSSEDWKRADKVLADAGLGGVTGFSGDNMRHVITKVAEAVLPTLRAALQRLAPAAPSQWRPNAAAIFEAIKHGDSDHQKWLRDKLNELLPEPPDRDKERTK